MLWWPSLPEGGGRRQQPLLTGGGEGDGRGDSGAGADVVLVHASQRQSCVFTETF